MLVRCCIGSLTVERESLLTSHYMLHYCEDSYSLTGAKTTSMTLFLATLTQVN